MSEIETGGPAFPRTYNGDGHNGLSLRDYFAAKAMHGWYSNPVPNDTDIHEVAAWAYRAADAMLAARSKP